jgi:hypothetical protein
MPDQDPIFARTRYSYDSYSDFWTLVELSGFSTCFVDEIDLQSENTYIVTPVNGELRPHITHRRTLGEQRARIIWWNLERPDSVNKMVPGGWAGAVRANLDDILKYVDEVWVSDRYYASYDPDRLRFVPLGSHAGLATHSRRSDFTYDVALMACMVPRREGIVHELKRRGLRIAPNAWGPERDWILAETAVMLNTHQHETWAPIGEPLRIALAAANCMCLVSERLGDPWPLESFLDFHEGPHTTALLADLVLALRGVASHLAEVSARHLHHTLCVDHSFRACVGTRLKDR